MRAHPRAGNESGKSRAGAVSEGGDDGREASALHRAHLGGDSGQSKGREGTAGRVGENRSDNDCRSTGGGRLNTMDITLSNIKLVAT